MLAFFVVIFLLSILGIFSNLGGALHRLGLPVWKTQNAISNTVENSAYIVRTKKSVFKENEDLRLRNLALESKMLDYNLLAKENEDLRFLLGRAGESKNFILGTIIAKPNKSFYDTLVLDAGLDHGVREGNIVYAQSEFPIGRISVVYDRTSVVTLFSSSDVTLNAQIEGLNTSVELVGRGGNNFEMDVPHELDVPTGTFVVAPFVNSSIVAIVVDVVSDPHDPVKKILLRSPVNVQDLKWVEILKN